MQCGILRNSDVSTWPWDWKILCRGVMGLLKQERRSWTKLKVVGNRSLVSAFKAWPGLWKEIIFCLSSTGLSQYFCNERPINRGKTNKFNNMHTSCVPGRHSKKYLRVIPKSRSQRSSLNFQLNYHCLLKGSEGCGERLLMGNWWAKGGQGGELLRESHTPAGSTVESLGVQSSFYPGTQEVSSLEFGSSKDDDSSCFQSFSCVCCLPK